MERFSEGTSEGVIDRSVALRKGIIVGPEQGNEE
jgi:hypothetical protein